MKIVNKFSIHLRKTTVSSSFLETNLCIFVKLSSHFSSMVQTQDRVKEWSWKTGAKPLNYLAESLKTLQLYCWHFGQTLTVHRLRMQSDTAEVIRQFLFRYHHQHQVAKHAGDSFYFMLKLVLKHYISNWIQGYWLYRKLFSIWKM